MEYNENQLTGKYLDTKQNQAYGIANLNIQLESIARQAERCKEEIAQVSNGTRRISDKIEFLIFTLALFCLIISCIIVSTLNGISAGIRDGNQHLERIASPVAEDPNQPKSH